MEEERGEGGGGAFKSSSMFGTNHSSRGVSSNYKELIDLAQEFKHDGKIFSLRHETKVVLKYKPKTDANSAVGDAKMPIKFYKKLQQLKQDPKRLTAQQ